MADISILGHIDGIKYTDTAAIVTLSERRLGYKKKDGVYIDDELITWRVLFKPYFKKYISEHFSNGMLVKIKGIVLPYAKTGDNEFIDGYSVIGQTIDLSAFPKSTLRIEKRMVKTSLAHSQEQPNLQEYNTPDF